jgi:hypothetical protein
MAELVEIVWIGIAFLCLVFGYIAGRADERRYGARQSYRAALLAGAIGFKCVDKANRRFVGESDAAFARRRGR